MKEGLKIWVIAEGEGLPLSDGARLMRAGMLAKYLSQNGHTVTWWASTFVHGTKSYAFNEHTVKKVSEHLKLILLHSKASYTKNVSLARMKYNKCLAEEFETYAPREEKPDIIVCAWPTPDFAKVAVEYGEQFRVPVILDARDMWPDIFVRAFPDKLQPLAEVGLGPMKKMAQKTFGKAAGVVAVTPYCLSWACAYADRRPGDKDEAIFIGCESLKRDVKDMEHLKEDWAPLGVDPNAWNLCYIGTLSASSIDLETVIKAVKELSKTYPDLYLLIGGDGDDKDRLKQIAGDCKNIIFLGWLNAEQMEYLIRISNAGAYCMKNLLDFKHGFGNKIIQYMAGSLPVLNSTQGFAKEFLSEFNVGVTYNEGDERDCALAIESLYKDKEGSDVKAKNAYSQFVERFEVSRVNKQYEEYLYKILR